MLGGAPTRADVGTGDRLRVAAAAIVPWAASAPRASRRRALERPGPSLPRSSRRPHPLTSVRSDHAHESRRQRRRRNPRRHYRGLAEVIRPSNDALLAIINETRGLSKMDAGRIKLAQ
jgi:hypothetical protein